MVGRDRSQRAEILSKDKKRREDACALQLSRKPNSALFRISHEVLWSAMRLRITFIRLAC